TASASARPGAHGPSPARRAAYLLFSFERAGDRHVISARQRGLDAEGNVGDLGALALDGAV
ncbi:metallophosphatase, partial [Methylobacterium hispanicum]